MKTRNGWRAIASTAREDRRVARRRGRVGKNGWGLEVLEDRTLLAVNPIVNENLLPGSPPEEWDIGGAGDTSLQGFATDISVDQGQTIKFKINDATLAAYHIDIYRLGYYGGLGARKVATIASSATLRRVQPSGLRDATTGLLDCGNWMESASWAVPASATSGLYIAKLVREDTGGASHIPFVVRDDDGQSDILYQTSDTTWQAYNNYGGNSLYEGSSAFGDRAVKVSYNRPWNTRATAGGLGATNWIFWAEYPMIRWLEQNGYNVSYSTDVDSDRNGAEIREHRAFLSVGHDEYWSAGQRANVEAARDAGVNLAFFSGNEVFWKTRWESSIDGSGTAYRTLVCYKETHANAKIDPLPNVWTGTWRDARFSPPADGGRPENSLTGTIFTVNRGQGGDFGTAIKVPEAEGKLRFWRNTSVATLGAGQTATLTNGTLGYEWDEDLDNGARPAGLIRLSSTVENVPERIQDNGSTYGSGIATHSLTLYRDDSGALVFGAGTVQWSFGLDDYHDGPSTVPDVRMRQATVNLFADMNIQPGSLAPGLVAATASNDALRPTSTITSPTPGTVLQVGVPVTINGTANDTGGGIVAAVEVSTDGGLTWHRATGRTSWSYSWTPSATGAVSLRTRAVDDSVNVEVPTAGVAVTVSSGNSLVAAFGFDAGAGTTAADSSGRGNNGTISGATWTAGRFGGALAFNGTTNWVTVNDANSLDLTTGMTLEAWVRPNALNSWNSVLLKETGSGLAYSLYANQDVPRPAVFVQVGGGDRSTAGTATLPLNTWSHLAATYDGNTLRFYVNGALANSAPLAGSITVSTGALRIGGNAFWGEYFNGSIDEVRIYNRALVQSEIQSDMNTPISVDNIAPTVGTISPTNMASGVAVSANVTAQFSEAIDSATITASTFELRGPGNTLVPAAVSYASASRTATLDATANLALATTYTARLRGGATGVKDLAGNPLASDFTWTFTTASAPPPPALTISDVSVTEGNSGTVNAVFNVNLSAASTQAVTVTYATANGSATAGSDYVALGPATLTFAPGETSKTIVVTIQGDTLTEGNETFFLNLSAPSNATLGDAQGQGTIVDDEAPTTIPGLVAAYGFNEGSGTTAGDSSGGGRNGTLSNATWSTAGRFGNALAFNGTNAWVTVNDANALDLTNGMTLEAWVNPTANSGWRTVLLKERPGSLAYALYSADDTGQPPAGYVNRGGIDVNATGTSALPLNTWSHLATSYDGAALRLYVNGTLVQTRALSGNISTSNNPLRIGGNAVWGEYFGGLIDEVRVYNRALTPAEIQTDMNTPIGGGGGGANAFRVASATVESSAPTTSDQPLVSDSEMTDASAGTQSLGGPLLAGSSSPQGDWAADRGEQGLRVPALDEGTLAELATELIRARARRSRWVFDRIPLARLGTVS